MTDQQQLEQILDNDDFFYWVIKNAACELKDESSLSTFLETFITERHAKDRLLRDNVRLNRINFDLLARDYYRDYCGGAL